MAAKGIDKVFYIFLLLSISALLVGGAVFAGDKTPAPKKNEAILDINNKPKPDPLETFVEQKKISEGIADLDQEMAALKNQIADAKNQIADAKKGMFDTTIASLFGVIGVFGVLATIIAAGFAGLGLSGWKDFREMMGQLKADTRDAVKDDVMKDVNDLKARVDALDGGSNKTNAQQKNAFDE